MDRIIDLDPYVISSEDFSKSDKKITENIDFCIGWIFTDDVYSLYNLNPSKRKWRISVNGINFILRIVENNTNSKKIIEVNSVKSTGNKVIKLLELQKINKYISENAGR